MVKDTIKYNEKEYLISTIYIENMITYETMIFPIENNITSGKEVYKFRTLDAQESIKKHADIINHPEKYLEKEVINKYLKSKDNEFRDTKYIREEFKQENFTEDELLLLRLAFKLTDDVVKYQKDGNYDVYMGNTLYNLKVKLGINNLL